MRLTSGRSGLRGFAYFYERFKQNVLGTENHQIRRTG